MEIHLSIKEIVSAFMVLFAIIDITGSIPIIVGLKQNGKKVEPWKAVIYSCIIFLSFLILGDDLLSMFGVDIESFAVAGAIIIAILAVEMILDIEIFKYNSPKGSATIVPIVFPLIAGAGALTTVISLRAEYHLINLIIAIILNMAVVLIVLKNLNLVERVLGAGGVYILRKFFGIILLAISIKLFITNLSPIF